MNVPLHVDVQVLVVDECVQRVLQELKVKVVHSLGSGRGGLGCKGTIN